MKYLKIISKNKTLYFTSYYIGGENMYETVGGDA